MAWVTAGRDLVEFRSSLSGKGDLVEFRSTLGGLLGVRMSVGLGLGNLVNQVMIPSAAPLAKSLPT